MKLSACIRRWRYVYGWRLRYWWLDTHSGRHARWTAAVVALLGLGFTTLRAGVAVVVPEAIPQPQTAIIWWIVWVVVSLVVGLAIALSASKPAAQKSDPQITKPVTQDGKSAIRYYGTNWVNEPAMLAWKVTGRDPIKTKGGKK